MKKSFLIVFLFIIPFIFQAQGKKIERGIPENEGISSKSILEMVKRFENELDAIHSYMIVKNGMVVSEGWWYPYGPNDPHLLYSLTKAYISTAVGFAVQENLLSVEDFVISFFPEYAPKNLSWNMQNLRVSDLLTYSTGHVGPVLKNKTRANVENWVKAFIESEIKLNPGAYSAYNSFASYILSAIIQKVSGQKVIDYLNDRFFIPLSIDYPEWDSCQMGINIEFGLHLKTEDIAKLGLFYLQNGVWNGKQLLSREWINKATSKLVPNGNLLDNDFQQGFGYQFWISRHNSYRGDGKDSQFCLILPDYEMAVVITAGEGNMQKVMNIVWESLLPKLDNKSLKKDPVNHKILLQKNKTLSLKTPKNKFKKKFEKEFKIEDNSLKIESIGFNLSKSKNEINIKIDGINQIIQIGDGSYVKNNLKNPLPYSKYNNKNIITFGMSEEKLKKIGTSGGWISNESYQIINYLYETPTRVVYNFTFKENELQWDTEVKNSLQEYVAPQIPLSLKSIKNE